MMGTGGGSWTPRTAKLQNLSDSKIHHAKSNAAAPADGGAARRRGAHSGRRATMPDRKRRGWLGAGRAGVAARGPGVGGVHRALGDGDCAGRRCRAGVGRARRRGARCARPPARLSPTPSLPPRAPLRPPCARPCAPPAGWLTRDVTTRAGPNAVPWTPRGVAQAWRIAAPQVDLAGARNPFAWEDAVAGEEAGEEESDFDSAPDSHESLEDAEAAADAPAPASKLTLAEDAIGLSVFSVVYSVMLANQAAQRLVRALVCMIASWASSPVRLLWTAASAAAGRCHTAASAAARDTAAELELLSQQHRDRLLRRDGVLHEAPLAPQPQLYNEDVFSTPLSTAEREPLDALQRNSLLSPLSQPSSAAATASSGSRASQSSWPHGGAASERSALSEKALRSAHVSNETYCMVTETYYTSKRGVLTLANASALALFVPNIRACTHVHKYTCVHVFICICLYVYMHMYV